VAPEVSVRGQGKLLSLGTYPDVSLKKARERRESARAVLVTGVDPSTVRKAVKASRTGGPVNSFETLAREFHETQREQWSEPHAKRWIERLEKDVFPYLGALALPDISAPMLLERSGPVCLNSPPCQYGRCPRTC